MRRVAILLGLTLASCVAGRARPPGLVQRPVGPAPSADAVLVHFQPRDEEAWTLRRADDSVVCALPCTEWIGPRSGMKVQLSNAPHGEPPTAYPLADPLPAEPGGSLTATVDRTHGLGLVGKIIAAPTAVLFGLMGTAFVGLGIAGLVSPSTPSTSTTTVCVDGGAACSQTSSTGLASNLTSVAVGTGALVIAGLAAAWFLHARDGGLELDGAQPPEPALQLAPGTSGSDSPGLILRVTPAGISGSF